MIMMMMEVHEAKLPSSDLLPEHACVQQICFDIAQQYLKGVMICSFRGDYASANGTKPTLEYICANMSTFDGHWRLAALCFIY